MEDFIEVMEKNIEDMTKLSNSSVKSIKNRELMQIILANEPPTIGKIHKGKDLGDLHFSVPLNELGITFDIFAKYEEELFSSYIGNFLGELFIRENINQFAEFITDLEAKEYMPVVWSWKHTKFGLEISGNCLIFRFNANLLPKILTGDFREKI